MSMFDEIKKINELIADLNLRLMAVRRVAGGLITHDLLSTGHPDTLPDNVVAGDMLFGNATPKWARKGIGSNGQFWQIVGGVPTWGAPGAVSEDAIKFFDHFADSSIFWAWRLHNITAQKTIVEAGSVLTISIDSGTSGDFSSSVNSAPKAIIGARGFPITIIVKLNDFTINDDTMAGIVFSSNVVGTPPNYCYVARIRNDSAGQNGITTYIWGPGHTYVADATLPVWFKIRISAEGGAGTKWVYDYSHDGIAYTNFLTADDPIAILGQNLTAALIGRNWGVNNAVAAPFEFFQMTPSFGPG